MAVLPMKRVLIVGLRRDRKKLLELLQRKGVMEITTGKSAEKTDEDSVFHRIDVSGQRQMFEKNVAHAQAALAVLDKEHPGAKDPGMFNGRIPMSLTDYETQASKRDKIMQMVSELNRLARLQADLQAEKPKVEAQMEALTPWKDYAYPLDMKETEQTRVFIGTLPNEQTREGILENFRQIAKEVSGIDVQIISASPEQTCVQVICLKKEEEQTEEALRRMSFARPSLSGGVPKKMLQDCEKRLVEIDREEHETKEKIEAYYPRRDELRFIIDYFRMRADKYDVIGQVNQSDKVFLINGYVPQKCARPLSELLESRFDCVVEFEEPSEEEEVPVALMNNGFAAPVEGVVSAYSLPGKGELDPSFLVALFYYFLFGMMLSDAAYGIIIVIACAFVLAKNGKTMEDGAKKSLKMFLFAGLGTLFWGAMYGSWFGNLPQTILQVFGPDPKAQLHLELWTDPTVHPMTVLGFSFIVGLVHVFIGMGVQAYMDIKAGKILDAVYDVFFWYLLLIGCVGVLLATPMVGGMFQLGPKGEGMVFSGTVKMVFKICCLIGAAGIILFGGRESKNPGLRFAKGLYALYGISSYLSDVLSYSRLLALGLATGVISNVFNNMAQMVGQGNGVVGAVFFFLIVIVGHTLNLAINALGAYVHTNRLQYVEFFGKFYSGGGKPFTPFAEKTQYYIVKE